MLFGVKGFTLVGFALQARYVGPYNLHWLTYDSSDINY